MSKKIFSLFVCFAIMFSGIPITAKSYENHQLSPATVCSDATPNFNNTSANNSSEAAKDTAPQVIDTDTTIGLMPGDKTLSELQQMSVDINAIPCFINSTFALQKKHVNRVMEQEANLNTVIYQNQDGTKTTYLFATPVKYIDETGAVKDKSTEITLLTDKTYALGMTNNLVKAYFSSSSSEGTKIEYQDYTISMIPHSETTSFATLIEKDLVKYDNVFGRNTTILYRTKLNGIKEDIVLFKNIEKNQFQFDLKLDNLTPVQMNQSWYLKNSKDELVASFGSILIEDSAGNTCLGSMAIVAKSSRNQYSVTITAPEEFLSAETTVYPVYIDPTIRIYEEGLYFYEDENGYEQDGHYTAIQDTGLYSTETAASDALANQTIHKLGYHTDSLNSSASGKIIYKLYDFFGPYGLYKDLLAEQIGSAFMYIDIAAGNATTLTAMPMSGTWDTDIYGASPLSICDDTLWNATDVTGAQSRSISAARGEYALSITNILKGWARYNAGERDNAYNPAYGFVLENNSTTSYRQINATEEFYADSVYVVMDISYTGGVFYVNNSLTGRFLKNDNYSLSTSLYEATDSIKWIFKYLGNGEYHILSFSNPQLILSCFDSDLAFVDIEEAEYDCCFWTITDVGARMITNVYNSCVLSFDGTSLSLVPEPSASDANYQQTLWTLARPNEYINLTDFELSDNWLLPNTQKTFYVRATATWATNAYFTWSIRADAGVSSQSVFTVSDLGEVWANSRGGTATLTVTHKPTGLVKTFTIKSGAIREGTYTIMNKGTSRYMNVEGISTASGAFIQQWDYHTGNHERWQLTILMSGSYIIKSVHSNLWLKAGNSTDNNAIIQYSTYGTTTAKWHITQTSAGNYKLSPINAETYAISVPLDVNNNGTRLIRSIYTNDTNYRDEWIFDNVGETQGIVSGSVYNIQAVHSNKVIEVQQGNTENGASIAQNAQISSHPWQRWEITYIDNGNYTIKDVNSGKYLSIINNSGNQGIATELRDLTGLDGQIFKIKQNDDGTYSFLSKSSYYLRALTVEGGSSATGAVICQTLSSGVPYQKFNLISRNKAIIILPGILGSELYAGENNPYFHAGTGVFTKPTIDILGVAVENIISSNAPILEKVKFTFATATFAYAFYDALLCDENGNSKHSMYVKEYREGYSTETKTDEIGFNDIYRKLYASLHDKFGNSYVIDFFSYDWRLTNTYSANRLDDYITRYQYDDVVLVAHSMGGLVASGYLGLGASQQAKVSQVIYLSSPLLGTPVAADIFYNENLSFIEEELEVALNLPREDIHRAITAVCTISNPIQNLICNYASFYELLPSEYYFLLTNDFYITVDDLFGNITCETYSLTREALTENFPNFNAELLTLAEEFHSNTFANGIHVSALVDSCYCYTVGIPTPSRFILNLQPLIPRLEHQSNTEGRGDGLVLESSATIATLDPSKKKEFNGNHMFLVFNFDWSSQIIP